MTLRELVWAAQGKQYAAWERTAEVMALIANCHRDKKERRRPYAGWDVFHRPGARRPKTGQGLTVDALHAVGDALTSK